MNQLWRILQIGRDAGNRITAGLAETRQQCRIRAEIPNSSELEELLEFMRSAERGFVK